MVELPDRLRCLFSATLEQYGDSYLLEVPREELDQDDVASGETYRVAVLPQASSQSAATATDSRQQHSVPPEAAERAPPVVEGDVREVTIETIGDRGDGIAKVERGYVVIVSETETGDEVSVEITNVRENVAFARVRDKENKDTADDSVDAEESFVDETLDELE